jgi:ribosome recycling factor
MSEELDQAKASMEKSLKALDHDFSSLRTGRPSVGILEDVKVDYYGVPTPITQVGAVKVPEGNLMTIEPWDKSIATAIEKAILAANLGVTPNNDGSGVIRLPFPAPTEERRKEIVKECRNVAEQHRITVRNARRDAKTKIDRLKKDGEIGEDEQRREEEQLQKLTDGFVDKIDTALAAKEAEVMEI